MKEPKTQWRWLLKRLACLLAATLLFACLLSAVLGRSVGGTIEETPAWASPGAKALKQVSAVDSAQHEPNFLNNLDCDLTDYRLVASSDMRTGCFTPTAFGLLDSDSDTVIFNGTDEALPLSPYWPGQVLVPWPNALDMVVLDAASTGGSYISLYKNPLAAVQDQRDGLLRLTGKRLVAPPDLSLRDPAGKQLVINAQALAFSDDGYWLVVETLSGSFIRVNLATLDMVAFAPAYAIPGSSALSKSQVAVSDNGRYVAIANDNVSTLKVYDLATCNGTPVDLRPQRCEAYDYFPFAQQRITGLQGIRHLRFINDGLLSFEARTTDSGSGGIYELAPRDSIGSLIDYLALGDSYTSGEGAFDYLAGTATADNMCHLSANSYPLLLTRALFTSAGGHSVACSGAVINDVGSTGSDYRGQVSGVAAFEQLRQGQAALLNSIMTNYLPGYVAQQRFVKQYQPAAITVSVGGNDIGFGDIIANCVTPHLSLRPSQNNCYASYEDRLELTDLIDRTVPRWAELYKKLAAEAPGGRIYAVGYPQIAVDNGNCALNVHLSQSELEFAQELIDYLNDHIRQAAARSGATYVDIGQALAGHRLCEAAAYGVAVNGLTAGKDGSVLGLRLFGKESYHPNALGQALMEQAILEQTHNLTLKPPVAIGKTGQNVLSVPKTGRKVNRVVPAKLTEKVARAGQSLSVKAGGAQNGLKSRTVYSIRLGGANGPVIGTTDSGQTGDIDANVTVPGNTTPGGQTIDITGENQAGEPVDVTQPVYVPASDSDADGDGLADTVDSCPGAINSGQDVDNDGVDDTCDGSINPPLAIGPPGSGGGISLDGGTVTVVTNFMTYNRQGSQIAVNGPIGQLSAKAGDVAQVLGTKTISPAVVSRSTFKAPMASASGLGGAGRLLKLKVINWLPWVMLLVIPWLLLLLGYCLGKLADLRTKGGTKSGSFQLQ